MKKLWCLVVLLALFIVSEAMAANVYLKDGSVVQCQSFWRSNSTVFVKVNRDVLLEFAQEDVNVKKTFRARPVQKAKRVKVRAEQPEKAESAVNETPATAGKTAPVTTVSPKTGNAPMSSYSTGTTAAKPGGKQAVNVGTLSSPVQANQPTSAIPSANEVTPQPVTNMEVPAPSAVAQAAGMGFGLTALIVPLLIFIIMIAAMWRVFEKAGEAGWKSIIPIYNLYVLVLIAGKPGWWFLIIALVPLIGLIFYLLVCLSLAQKFDKGPIYGVLLCFFGFIMFPLLAFDNSTYTP